MVAKALLRRLEFSLLIDPNHDVQYSTVRLPTKIAAMVGSQR
jgi:hypothetical protein